MSELSEKTAAELFGGGAVPRNTREKLLFTAINLFQEHGYHAIGIDHILAEAKLTKSTFYNHFESRDELVVEAVKLRDAWEIDSFTKLVQERAGFDPKAMLLAMFDVLDEWFNHPDYRGCMFIAAVSEFPSPDNPVRRAASAHFATVGENVRKMAESIGIREADAFAREWVLLLEGTNTYRAVAMDNNAARITKRIAETRLADYLP